MDRLWTLISIFGFCQLCFSFDCGPSCGCESLDCQDYKDFGHTTSGEYWIIPSYARFGFKAYCDMDTDGGGWLVFQRRENGSVKFQRRWNDYVLGFGHISGEHWLGLVKLRRLVAKGNYELRVDLEDWRNRKRYVKYSLFNVGTSAQKYKLEAAGYDGDAGDSLRSLNGQMFSTIDQDNDASAKNCSAIRSGAWWYNGCGISNLNGMYYSSGGVEKANGIFWKTWQRKGKNSLYSLKKVEMKIRKA